MQTHLKLSHTLEIAEYLWCETRIQSGSQVAGRSRDPVYETASCGRRGASGVRCGKGTTIPPRTCIETGKEQVMQRVAIQVSHRSEACVHVFKLVFRPCPVCSC